MRDNQRGCRFPAYREFVHLATGAQADAYAIEKNGIAREPSLVNAVPSLLPNNVAVISSKS